MNDNIYKLNYSLYESFITMGDGGPTMLKGILFRGGFRGRCHRLKSPPGQSLPLIWLMEENKGSFSFHIKAHTHYTRMTNFGCSGVPLCPIRNSSWGEEMAWPKSPPCKMHLCPPSPHVYIPQLNKSSKQRVLRCLKDRWRNHGPISSIIFINATNQELKL